MAQTMTPSAKATFRAMHAANRGERISVVFINNTVYGMEAAACDYERLNELCLQKNELQAGLNALYEKWETLSEEAE